MIQQERKTFILEMLDRGGKVKAVDVAEKFGVSMETVRRDLEELQKNRRLFMITERYPNIWTRRLKFDIFPRWRMTDRDATDIGVVY